MHGKYRCIRSLRLLKLFEFKASLKKARIYQDNTSELYDLVQEVLQKQSTLFYPRRPYAVAKMYAYWITKNYQKVYGMYA